MLRRRQRSARSSRKRLPDTSRTTVRVPVDSTVREDDCGDFRLQMVTIPVVDVDRAKAFYVDQAGFAVEQDVQVDDHCRFVELMPPGSPCSIALTAGYVDAAPGSLKGVQLNVD